MKVIMVSGAQVRLDGLGGRPEAERAARKLQRLSMRCVDVLFENGRGKTESWSNGTNVLVACVPAHCGRPHAARAAFELGRMGAEADIQFGDDGRIYFWVWWD